ncbi:hypothetical protein BJ322DRAFT_1042931 [Thelephora terrestris]|uniref:Protein kinase domain-containing protein n=1 Tax=Thelephora terrestris TaxID=56493 RepID=A0A9P6HMH1_9AGAM|nr:hypothetical protein BJ322DRAFT_1042931 [Thelephora terrestris]
MSIELRKICGSRTTLPQLCQLPSHRLIINHHPFATGGYGDVYLATLDGSKVRVNRVRVPHQKYLPLSKRSFCEGVATWKRLEHPNIVILLGATLFPLQLISNWMPNVAVLCKLR